MKDLKSRLARLTGGAPGQIGFEQGRVMLDHPDKAVRLALAARTDLDCEMLFFLAGDPDPDVRLAVANNTSTPGTAWLVLADDHSDDVRIALAERLPALLDRRFPDSDRSIRSVVATLRLLVRDTFPDVRRALANVLREMSDVPPDIIRTLAHDRIEQIAVPIIELSPVLTDADLMEIVRTSPFTRAMRAVARRPRLSEIVSDALVRTGDSGVIESLLRNPSAQIREETLDLIADMAPSQPRWHRPLTRRPGLSPEIMKKIVAFVAGEILNELVQRTDLDPNTLALVRQTALERLNTKAEAAPDPLAAATAASALRLAQFRAEALQLSGRLTRSVILDAVVRGPSALSIAMLAVQGRLPVSSVATAVRRGQPRALLAVAWAADLSAQDAVLVQHKLGHATPDSVIMPGPTGMYDASESELQYALDGLSAPAEMSAA